MPRTLSFGWLVALAAVLLAGCTAAPLARPAIVGASASAGFGCEAADADGKPCLVDMEAVYLATVTGWHTSPIFLADAAFYSAPRKAQEDQMNAALAQGPTVIVGIDYLFWSVYGRRDDGLTADQVERDRHDALEQALAQLDRFHGPVIVSDIPDMNAATARMLSERMVPPPAQIDAFNRRIQAWSKARPAGAPAAVIPVAALAAAIRAGQPIATTRGPLPADASAGMLQPDQLHPTPTGLVVLLREGLDRLAAQGAIPPDAYRADIADVVSRLPAEARAVEQRREPGLWTLLSIKGKLKDFGDAVEKKDCAQASQLFDQIMEKATRLKKSPHDAAGLFIAFTLFSYRASCADAATTVRRWRDRLEPQAQRPLPDPWPLQLWADFNGYLDDDQRTIDRMLALKRAHPDLSSDYDDPMRSAARDARLTQPAVYLELSPPWQQMLDHDARIAADIAAYWTGFAKTAEWQPYIERSYKEKLAFAVTDERREQIKARRDYYLSPESIIASSRALTLDDIVLLERALRLTGQAEPADSVKARLESIAPAAEVTESRERIDKEAASLTKPRNTL